MVKKKFHNIVLISVCIFSVSILAGYIAYTVLVGAPLKEQKSRFADEPKNINTFTGGEYVSEETEERETVEEYYVIKENAGKIGVYAYKADKLEFLYNIDTSFAGLPEQDQELIKQGIVLYTKEELAHFEEDYGS